MERSTHTHHALARAAEARAKLLRRLGRAFPGVSPDELEDAVQQAFLQALEHPDRFQRACEADGDDGMRWLGMVGWRHLRGERRRRGVRRAAPMPADDLAPTGPRRDEVELRDEVRQALVLLNLAAQQNGPRWTEPLRQALVLRIVDGETDAAAARQCGIPREYVNRARRWMATQLEVA